MNYRLIRRSPTSVFSSNRGYTLTGIRELARRNSLRVTDGYGRRPRSTSRRLLVRWARGVVAVFNAAELED